ncbi:MAG: aminoglycoside phosphotransferase family protein [Anaerolineae bacterium]|nr:aminoglycoside phosphotransferase family protein [Anaerolineae bacterium]
MESLVRRAIALRLPGRTILAVRDRGEWVRRIFEITLDGDQVVFLKLSTHPEWLETSAHEAEVARILHAHGLPAPQALAVDTSRQILPHPYIVQERVDGTRLGDLLDGVDEADALAIYHTLGRFYRRMHAIHHHRSGVWLEDPEVTFDVSPNDYMYRAEIVEGSGRRALEQGRISERTYERAVALWGEHLGYLKEHQPSLVHMSAFPWTIRLERESGWRVTGLSALGDVLWWDPAWDLACMRYPPFMEASAARWEAFLGGYGSDPERKRLLLYAVMQRLSAAMGAYMEPKTERSAAWASTCLADVETFLDEIERL